MENPKRTRMTSLRRPHGENTERDEASQDDKNIATDITKAKPQETRKGSISQRVAALGRETAPELASNAAYIQPQNVCDTAHVEKKKMVGTIGADTKVGDVRSSSRIRNRFASSKNEKSDQDEKSMDVENPVRLIRCLR